MKLRMSSAGITVNSQLCKSSVSGTASSQLEILSKGKSTGPGELDYCVQVPQEAMPIAKWE